MDKQPTFFPEHEWDYVTNSVERVKLAWQLHHMMNPDGKKMLMAFSGGKDSICLFYVCKQAAEEMGMDMQDMVDVQYNITCVDPPELVYFVREMKKTYPFIKLHHPEKTMWELIAEKKMPPIRMVRYCCSSLKEVPNIRGVYSLTGVRRAESVQRSSRGVFDILANKKSDRISTDHILLNDNEDRRVSEFCMQKKTYVCNPIIDWSDEDVWHFIREKNLPYCKLYDEGFKRLGCIGCPMAPVREREMAFSRWPGFKKCYIRAFERMIANNPSRNWKDAEEAFEWWLYGEGRQLGNPLFEEASDGQ